MPPATIVWAGDLAIRTLLAVATRTVRVVRVVTTHGDATPSIAYHGELLGTDATGGAGWGHVATIECPRRMDGALAADLDGLGPTVLAHVLDARTDP